MPGQLFSAYLKIFTECTSTYITRTDLKKMVQAGLRPVAQGT